MVLPRASRSEESHGATKIKPRTNIQMSPRTKLGQNRFHERRYITLAILIGGEATASIRFIDFQDGECGSMDHH